MEFNTIGTIIFAGKCCMHTIIKIAVVSVLSLFAIVGLVSISKAEETVWYCEMNQNIWLTPDGIVKWNTDNFKMKVTQNEIRFGSGGPFNNKVRKKESFLNDWFINKGEFDILAFDSGIFSYSNVTAGMIISITAKCEKF